MSDAQQTTTNGTSVYVGMARPHVAPHSLGRSLWRTCAFIHHRCSQQTHRYACGFSSNNKCNDSKATTNICRLKSLCRTIEAVCEFKQFCRANGIKRIKSTCLCYRTVNWMRLQRVVWECWYRLAWLVLRRGHWESTDNGRFMFDVWEDNWVHIITESG